MKKIIGLVLGLTICFSLVTYAAGIYGTMGDDVINGTDEDDVIIGLAGNDVIHGQLGNDRLYGGKGNDILQGTEGNNKLFGNKGDDYLGVYSGQNKLFGGEGNDTYDAYAFQLPIESSCIIKDTAGVDTIEFNRVNSSSISVYPSIKNNKHIVIDIPPIPIGSGYKKLKIRIVDFIVNPSIEYFEFEDITLTAQQILDMLP